MQTMQMHPMHCKQMQTMLYLYLYLILLLFLYLLLLLPLSLNYIDKEKTERGQASVTLQTDNVTLQVRDVTSVRLSSTAMTGRR